MVRMHSISASGLCGLTAVLALGCQSAAPGEPDAGVRRIHVRTERDQYRPGDRVTVVIANVGADTVRFNSCPADLARLYGSRWVELDGSVSVRSCTDQGYSQYPILPGEFLRRTFPLSPSLAPGTYRITYVDVGLRQAEQPSQAQQLPLPDRVSEPFTVR